MLPSTWNQPSVCTDKSFTNRDRLSTCYVPALEQEFGDMAGNKEEAPALICLHSSGARQIAKK